MTISSTEVKKQYVANGVTVDFAFPYLFLLDEHLKVYSFNPTTATEAEVTVGITKTGAGDPAGGTVTFLAPPAAGLRITLYREVPLTQETDYVENTKFSADAHERALDLLTMQNQQHKEALGRTVKLPVSTTVSNISLPDPSAKRGLRWNAGGTDLENTTYDPDDLVTLSLANAQAAQGAQAASEAARDQSVAAKDTSQAAQTASEAARDLSLQYRNEAEAFKNALNLPSATPADKGKALVVNNDGTGYTLGAASSPGADLYLTSNIV